MPKVKLVEYSDSEFWILYSPTTHLPKPFKTFAILNITQEQLTNIMSMPYPQLQTTIQSYLNSFINTKFIENQPGLLKT